MTCSDFVIFCLKSALKINYILNGIYKHLTPLKWTAENSTVPWFCLNLISYIACKWELTGIIHRVKGTRFVKTPVGVFVFICSSIYSDKCDCLHICQDIQLWAFTAFLLSLQVYTVFWHQFLPANPPFSLQDDHSKMEADHIISFQLAIPTQQSLDLPSSLSALQSCEVFSTPSGRKRKRWSLPEHQQGA